MFVRILATMGNRSVRAVLGVGGAAGLTAGATLLEGTLWWQFVGAFQIAVSLVTVAAAASLRTGRPVRPWLARALVLTLTVPAVAAFVLSALSVQEYASTVPLGLTWPTQVSALIALAGQLAGAGLLLARRPVPAVAPTTTLSPPVLDVVRAAFGTAALSGCLLAGCWIAVRKVDALKQSTLWAWASHTPGWLLFAVAAVAGAGLLLTRVRRQSARTAILLGAVPVAGLQLVMAVGVLGGLAYSWQEAARLSGWRSTLYEELVGGSGLSSPRASAYLLGLACAAGLCVGAVALFAPTARSWFAGRG